MGGIKTKVDGTTSLEGLYAIGEASCTGLHGANRLASNSILECAVTAYELVNLLKTKTLINNFTEDEEIQKTIKMYDEDLDKTKVDTNKIFAEIKNIMWQDVGIIRNEEMLLKAKKEISLLKDDFAHLYKCADRNCYEIRNMLTVASLITDFALKRKESRGAHFREDYPQCDPEAKSQQISRFAEMKG
jgi:L-aspartate oxidase